MNLRENGQDLRETLLRSSNIENTTRNNTKIDEILRENEKRRGRVNNENNLKLILERHLTDEIHSYVNFEKNLRITPGKLEESGKILGKTCGLGPTEEITPLKRDIEQIDDAPKQLKYLNEVTTSN